MPRIFVVNLAGDVVLGPVDGPVTVAELLQRLTYDGRARAAAPTPVLQQGTRKLRPRDVVGGEDSESDVTLTLVRLSFVSRLQVTLEKLREGARRLETELGSLGFDGVALTDCTRRQAEARCALLDAETKVRAELIYHRNSEAYILDHALPIARWYELYQHASDMRTGTDKVGVAYRRLADSHGISLSSLLAGIRSSTDWTDGDALQMLRVADEDGNGWVTMSEFEHILSKFPAVVRYVRLAD